MECRLGKQDFLDGSLFYDMFQLMIQHKMVFHLITFHKQKHPQTTNQLHAHTLQLYFVILRFLDLYNPVYQLQYQSEQDHPKLFS
jgi:hypothetical protein